MTYVWSEQHASVGYTKLKDEQLRTVRDVLSGLDTFVSLLTGYSKLLCYAILPWLLMNFRTPRMQALYWLFRGL